MKYVDEMNELRGFIDNVKNSSSMIEANHFVLGCDSVLGDIRECIISHLYNYSLNETIKETKSSFPIDQRNGWVKSLINIISEKNNLLRFKGCYVLDSDDEGMPVIPFIKDYIINVNTTFITDKVYYTVNYNISKDFTDDGRIKQAIFNVNFHLDYYSVSAVAANFVYHEFLHAYEEWNWMKNGNHNGFLLKYGVDSHYQSLKKEFTGKDGYFDYVYKVLYFLSDIEQRAYTSQAISNIENKVEKNKYLDNLYTSVVYYINQLIQLEDKDIQDSILVKLKNVYGNRKEFDDYQKFLKYLYKLIQNRYKIFRIKVNRNICEGLIENKRTKFGDTVYF